MDLGSAPMKFIGEKFSVEEGRNCAIFDDSLFVFRGYVHAKWLLMTS